MSQPTKEQWDDLRRGLNSVYGSAYLQCDGYLIHLTWERDKKTCQSYTLAVYVDGYIKGGWMAICQKEDEPITEVARRFYRLSRKQLHNTKYIRQMEKIFGKRHCRTKGYYDKRVSSTPYWNTVDTCTAHLRRHNQDIKILDHDAYRVALNQKLEGKA